MLGALGAALTALCLEIPCLSLTTSISSQTQQDDAQFMISFCSVAAVASLASQDNETRVWGYEPHITLISSRYFTPTILTVSVLDTRLTDS